MTLCDRCGDDVTDDSEACMCLHNDYLCWRCREEEQELVEEYENACG